MSFADEKYTEIKEKRTFRIIRATKSRDEMIRVVKRETFDSYEKATELRTNEK